MTTDQTPPLVPRCDAQNGANSATDYRVWDCELPDGHYGAHREMGGNGVWTDATVRYPAAPDTRPQEVLKMVMTNGAAFYVVAANAEAQAMADARETAVNELQSALQEARDQVGRLKAALGEIMEMHEWERGRDWSAMQEVERGRQVGYGDAAQVARTALASPPPSSVHAPGGTIPWERPGDHNPECVSQDCPGNCGTENEPPAAPSLPTLEQEGGDA